MRQLPFEIGALCLLLLGGLRDLNVLHGVPVLGVRRDAREAQKRGADADRLDVRPLEQRADLRGILALALPRDEQRRTRRRIRRGLLHVVRGDAPPCELPGLVGVRELGHLAEIAAGSDLLDERLRALLQRVVHQRTRADLDRADRLGPARHTRVAACVLADVRHVAHDGHEPRHDDRLARRVARTVPRVRPVRRCVQRAAGRSDLVEVVPRLFRVDGAVAWERQERPAVRVAERVALPVQTARRVTRRTRQEQARQVERGAVVLAGLGDAIRRLADDRAVGRRLADIVLVPGVEPSALLLARELDVSQPQLPEHDRTVGPVGVRPRHDVLREHEPERQALRVGVPAQQEVTHPDREVLDLLHPGPVAGYVHVAAGSDEALVRDRRVVHIGTRPVQARRRELPRHVGQDVARGVGRPPRREPLRVYARLHPRDQQVLVVLRQDRPARRLLLASLLVGRGRHRGALRNTVPGHGVERGRGGGHA